MSVEVDSRQAARAWREINHDLPEAICSQLIELAKASSGIEVCGFILSDGTVASVTNVDPNPSKGFTMDKDEMMAIIHGKNGIAATFHSHPSGRKWPSKTDTENMSFLYRQGCPWRYIIVTAEGVFEFEHNGS